MNTLVSGFVRRELSDTNDPARLLFLKYDSSNYL